jgi:lysophospholipase L1-like esterase
MLGSSASWAPKCLNYAILSRGIGGKRNSENVNQNKKSCLAWGCLVGLTLCSAAQAAQWVQTWGAAPLPPTAALGPFPATPSFNNQTIRQTVRISVGGQRIRIRFTNEYGTKPLTIAAAVVASADEKGNIQPGTQRRLLFSGQPGIAIPAAAPLLSDPVDLPVKSLSSLSISLYVPAETGQCTCHQTGVQNAFVSDSGDFTDKAFTPSQTLQMRAFISGVEVESRKNTRAVVVLGDSISDGVGATLDANHRWPDLLANRLEARQANTWGVVNMGISGNRVLGDGAGQSALARFDRDVLSTPGVKLLIIFEGVNDLGISYGNFQGPMAEMFKARAPAVKVTAAAMLAGYRQLIARAHEKGIKVLGATITPYGGAMYFSPEGEAVRQAINTWIRTGHEVDGVIDFDAVMRDPGEPTQIKEGFHMGDHLHGSDAGYAAMAAAINLALF